MNIIIAVVVSSSALTRLDRRAAVYVVRAKSGPSRPIGQCFFEGHYASTDGTQRLCAPLACVSAIRHISTRTIIAKAEREDCRHELCTRRLQESGNFSRAFRNDPSNELQHDMTFRRGHGGPGRDRGPVRAAGGLQRLRPRRRHHQHRLDAQAVAQALLQLQPEPAAPPRRRRRQGLRGLDRGGRRGGGGLGGGGLVVDVGAAAK